MTWEDAKRVALDREEWIKLVDALFLTEWPQG